MLTDGQMDGQTDTWMDGWTDQPKMTQADSS